MARPKFVQARKTTLKVPLTSSEVDEIVLKNLVDAYGNDLEVTDFQDEILITFNPGGQNEEIVRVTSFTRQSDGSIICDDGIERGLSAVYPYASGGTPRNHAAGTVVVVSNNPQMYEAILDYIDGISIAGAPNASNIQKGIVELAIASEIDSDSATGATGAAIAVTPDQLALSKYASSLVTANQALFLGGVVGMTLPYLGLTAPTGFFLAQGALTSNNAYSALAAVCLGRHFLSSDVGTAFTVTEATDTVNATAHGLSNGDILLLTSSGTLPTGLSLNTLYYVINSTTNSFKLSTSSGGSAVDITGAGTGTHGFHTQFRLPNIQSRFLMGMGQSVETFSFLPADVNTGTEIITVPSNKSLYTGQAVVFSTTGGAPAGLAAGTYYVIYQSDTTIKLASSLANAVAGTAINITSQGTGVHTLTRTLTSRSIGDKFGEETHALTSTEIPAHTHDVVIGSGGNGSAAYSASAQPAGTTTFTSTSVGGSTAHNVLNPGIVFNFIIKY